MKIHKEGYKIIAASILFVLVVLLAVNLIWNEQTWYHYALYAAGFILIAVVIRFFRIPTRSFTEGNDLVICPADGTIVAIEETFVEEFFGENRRQISVFMSPNNVHVNLYPVSGKIVYTNYWPGTFLVAWHPKSSTENERNTVVIDNHKHGPVMVRQIAGALARRIVCYAHNHEKINQGCELGFIKFGSRVDVFLPLTAKIDVKLNQKVKGGVTVLARF